MGYWMSEKKPNRPPEVYPLDDTREHITDGRECWCNPVTDDWGVVVRNSADDRERYERGERKPN